MTDMASEFALHQVREALVESLARVPGGTREKAEDAARHLDVATFLGTDGEPDRVKIETFAAQADMTPTRSVNEMRADKVAGRTPGPRPGSMAEMKAQRLAKIQERNRR